MLQKTSRSWVTSAVKQMAAAVAAGIGLGNNDFITTQKN